MRSLTRQIDEWPGDGDGQAVDLHIDENRVARGRRAHACELARALGVARQVVDATLGREPAHELLARAVLGQEHVTPRGHADVVGHIQHVRRGRFREKLEMVGAVARVQRELEHLTEPGAPTRRAAQVDHAVAEEDAFTAAEARSAGGCGLVAHRVVLRIGVGHVDPIDFQTWALVEIARRVEARYVDHTQSLQLA